MFSSRSFLVFFIFKMKFWGDQCKCSLRMQSFPLPSTVYSVIFNAGMFLIWLIPWQWICRRYCKGDLSLATLFCPMQRQKGKHWSLLADCVHFIKPCETCKKKKGCFATNCTQLFLLRRAHYFVVVPEPCQRCAASQYTYKMHIKLWASRWARENSFVVQWRSVADTSKSYEQKRVMREASKRIFARDNIVPVISPCV